MGALVVAGCRCRASLGPAAEVLRADHLLLEQVDALDKAGEEWGGVATDLVAAQRKVVDALQQQREPVSRAHRREQRVNPRLERLVAQDPLTELLRAED